MCLGSGARNPISLSPLPLNKWSHVAAVWEGNKGMLYLDGNLVATEIYSCSYPASQLYSFTIGAARGGTEKSSSGIIEVDYVQVAATGLSAATLSQMVSTPDLLLSSNQVQSLSAYWRCNSAHNSSRWTDASARHQDADFQHGATCVPADPTPSTGGAGKGEGGKADATGIIVGCLVAAAALAVALYYFVLRKQSPARRSNR